MNKENNRNAAGLRRSAIAERIRLREEWSELKGTSDQNQSLTASNIQKPAHTLMKKQPRSRLVTPGNPETNKMNYPRTCVKTSAQIKDVLMGVVALVEVGTESRALPLRAALTALGATVVPSWTPIVTHVVWAQGGCRSTRAKARALASRLVSPLWVEACAAAQRRLPELTFPAAARASDLPSPRTLRQLLNGSSSSSLRDVVSSDRPAVDDVAFPVFFSTTSDSGAEALCKNVEELFKVSKCSSVTTAAKAGYVKEKKKAEMENIPLIDLLPDKDKADGKTRLRLSSDTENDTSRDTTNDTSRDTTNDSHDTSHETSRDTSHNKTETRVNTAARRALPISISPAGAPKSRRKLFNNREADETKEKAGDESDEETKRPTRLRVAKPTPRDRRELARAERMARRLLAAAAPAPASAPATATARNVRPRIVLTGMNKLERRTITAAIQSLNGRIQNHVTRKTTHVILGSCHSDTDHCSGNVTTLGANIRKSPRNKGLNITGVSTITTATPLIVHRSDITKARTLNALLGAARGARVLNTNWVLDSKAKGHWVHPYGYEVPHLKKIFEKARIERNALGRMNSEYAYDVFNGMCVRISPNAEQKDAATQLLKLCGAVVQDGGCEQNGGHDLTIGSGDGEVSSKWVFDSVAAARMRTTRRYVNNPLSNTLLTQTTDR